MNQETSNSPEDVAQDVRAATAGVVLIAAILGIVAFFYLGPIVQPLFVAAFLYYLVTPPAEMLIQRGVRRWLAYLVAVFLLAALLAVFGFIVYANVQAVEKRFPYYRDRLVEWSDTLARETRVVGGLPPETDEAEQADESEVQEADSEAGADADDRNAPIPADEILAETPGDGDASEPDAPAVVSDVPEAEPAPTLDATEAGDDPQTEKDGETARSIASRRQRQPVIPPDAGGEHGPLGDLFDVSPKDAISWGFGTAVGFIGNFIAVMFYLAFIILESHKFPDRFRRAFADDTAEDFVAFGKKVTESVRQYLVLKTLVSIGTGCTAAAVMLLFGLEFWPLWAVLTFLFNYVPYIGSLAATAFPVLVGFIQFGNPWVAGVMAILLVCNQQVWGNLVEPQVMGKHLNISPLALLVFVAFWGWLWGIVGMVLSVPLAVFIKMLLGFFPRTRKVAILISAD